MFGQCLSPNVGDHALTSPTRHSLGEPLPHQQADRTQAAPQAINLYSEENYLALFLLSKDYSRLEGTFLCITNPFAVGLNPRDLHALSTPPAFILSQDQTLNKNYFKIEDSKII